MRTLRHIVIVREDKLGDSCLSLPVLEALLHLSPDTRVTWVCQEAWRPLFQDHPSVQNVLSKPKKPSLTEAFTIGRELRALDPDAILLLRAGKRWQQAAKFSGIPIRIGHTPRPPTGSLTHDAWDIAKRRIHISRRALDVLSMALEYEVQDFPAVLRLSPEVERQAQAECDQANLPSSFFAVQIGMGGSSASVPTSVFAGAALRVFNETGLVPVLTGGKGEEHIAKEFESHFGSPVLSMIGQTKLPALAELLRRSKFLLSLDTGTTHLAAAVAKPCVVLMPKLAFGGGEWCPWMVDQELLRPSQFCSQCTILSCGAGDRSCVRGFEVERVADACLRLLGRIGV